ncbi:MAG: TonB-dependent receptor [Pseudomonadota bacterium]
MRKLTIAASAIALMSVAAPATALAQQTGAQQVEIAAQPLSQALSEIARRYGVRFRASEQLTRGKRAPRIAGTLTAEQAFARALSGSGLVARRGRDGAFVIARASAQTTSAATSTASSPESSQRNEQIVLTEPIIVSGQKIDRTLQETTDSVAVLTGETIDNSYITDLGEVFVRIPNVTEGLAGEGIAIRGIPERGAGTGTGDTSQAIAIYVDGAVQSQAGAVNGILGTWDVAQIEVYRGPQTTTQGRAGLAGAVIVETADPTFEWTGRARAAYGDFDTYQLAGAIGGPIIPDLLAFRVATDINRTDGFTRFESGDTVINDVGRDDRDVIRTKLLFTPASNIEAVASYTYSSARRGSDLVDIPDTFDPVTERAVSIIDTEVNSVSLEVNVGLSDAVRLTSVTAYTDLQAQTAPIPATLGEGGVTISDVADEAFTQELRLTYDDGGPVRGIAGLYYADLEEMSDRDLTVPLGFTTAFVNDGFANSFENFAIFGEVEIDLGPNWTLVAGGRYDTEDSSRSEFITSFADPPVPFLPNASTSFSGDASFNAFLPKAGITYNFSPDASFGFVAQRAYRPGGADINPVNNEAIEFAPEFLWNYELVLRISSPDNRLTFNANIFYTDYDDMQIRVSPNPAIPTIRFIDNAGSAELYGFEIESAYRATQDLSFYASFGYIESEFDEFAFQGLDLSGNEFPLQPTINFAAGGTYEDKRGISATLDLNYSDNYFSQVQNGPELEVDQRFLVNARIGYKGDFFGIYAYAQNLLDADFQQSAFRDPDPVFTNAILGQPQTFGVILEADF